MEASMSPFLLAAQRKPTPHTPIWIMRQAGRYLPEYQAIRQKVSFMELCKTPELAAEVTVQPVDRLGVDAAILFCDILIPAEAMGLEVVFQPSGGPKIMNPVRSQADVDALCIPDPHDTVPFVFDAIRQTKDTLNGRVPLIGFAGAPFTMACYMVEGMGSKNYAILKELMFTQPGVFHNLMDTITETTIVYLNAKIAAGAQAVQLFDSWGGILGRSDYQEYALPYSKRILEALKDSSAPTIHYINNGGHLLDLISELPNQVIGVDWRVDLADAVGHRRR